MAKILNTNELLDLARSDEIKKTPALMRAQTGLILAQEALANELARQLGLDPPETSDQPGFGGLCSTFRTPNPVAVRIFDELELDPDGEWN